MKYFLFVALSCLAVMLFGLIRKAGKSKGELKKPVVRLLWMAVFTVIMQGIFAISGNYQVAKFALSCYYVSIDWLLIALLSYMEVYTRIFEGKKAVKAVVYGIAIVDSANLLLNMVFDHVFLVYQGVLNDGHIRWLIDSDTPSFVYHFTFSYLLLALCGMALVVKSIRTPAFYRRKYASVLISFMSLIAIDVICIFIKSPYDISVFPYVLLSVLLCYYSLFYKPTGLIDKTLALVAEDISDAVFCYDFWGECVFTNKMAEESYGQAEVREVLRKLFEAKRREIGPECREAVQFKERLELGGLLRFFDVSYHKLFDGKQNYVGDFFTLRDRTDEVRKFQEEHYRLAHDKLTGMFNREYFFEAVEKVLVANPDVNYYMVCSDIKGFKFYNDLYGEKVGNEVLKMEAELMAEDATEEMVYGRIAGDEFALLIPEEQYDDSKIVKNINLVRERFNNEQYQLHICVGVYKIQDRTESISVMCDKAKLAIEAHRGDFNSIMTYYDNKLLEKSLYERKIVGEFDRALEGKEFCMYLQPQIASDGRLLGAEALVRWNHPERGIVFPGDFIGVFERTGLIYRLDRYMWERAAEKLCEWQAEGRKDLYISVNISPKDFYCMDIYGELTRLVERYNISPKNMKLEITETVLITEAQSRLSLIERLRDYGFEVEIDDFGSGYSSLNMLKDIDVDIVKIDMGFLDETERLERGASILNSIIALLKKLDMGVITEGVETKEQVESLMEMGCHMFQGYYFDKPMPVADFEQKYG